MFVKNGNLNIAFWGIKNNFCDWKKNTHKPIYEIVNDSSYSLFYKQVQIGEEIYPSLME